MVRYGLKNHAHFTGLRRYPCNNAHANNGVALKTLQDTAGHASLSTTATYLHKSDKERHDELMTSLENPWAV